jgi:hypothetical protein
VKDVVSMIGRKTLLTDIQHAQVRAIRRIIKKKTRTTCKLSLSIENKIEKYIPLQTC